MFGQSHRAKTVDNSSDSVRVDKLTKFPFADYETKELVQRVNKHWTLSIMTCSCSAFTSSLSTGFWFTGSADRARIFAAKLGYVFLDTAYLHSSKVLCFRKKRSTITSLAFLTAVTIDEIEFSKIINIRCCKVLKSEALHYVVIADSAWPCYWCQKAAKMELWWLQHQPSPRCW
jgi:hypothetical protein